MQIPKSNVTPMVRTAPVDPKFLMMAAAMMKGEGKLDPKLDPKDVRGAKPTATGSSMPTAAMPLAQRPQGSSGSQPNPGQVAGSSST